MRADSLSPWLFAATLACGVAVAQARPADAAATAAQAPTSTQPDEATMLGEFTDHFGFKRKYVKVRPGMGDEEIVETAKRLHAQEPKTWFWLLDNDAKAAQLLAALPKIEKGEDADYPREWVQKHSVAHIQLELVPGAPKRWVVAKGYGSDTLAVLGEDG